MIRLHRDEAPPSLKRLGGKQTAVECAKYDSCPDDFRSGKARFRKRKREYYN